MREGTREGLERGISAAVVVLAAIAGATFPSVPATAVPTVIDVRVAASSDDAEELSGGSVSLTSSDLELVTDGTVVSSPETTTRRKRSRQAR